MGIALFGAFAHSTHSSGLSHTWNDPGIGAELLGPWEPCYVAYLIEDLKGQNLAHTWDRLNQLEDRATTRHRGGDRV